MEGANEQGAETKLVHLYEHSYHGCVSCFSCKRKGGIHGVCAMKDELTSVLLMLHDSDAIIWGSPIYFMSLSSGMAACLERFLFPGTIYSKVLLLAVFVLALPKTFAKNCSHVLPHNGLKFGTSQDAKL